MLSVAYRIGEKNSFALPTTVLVVVVVVVVVHQRTASCGIALLVAL